MLDRGKGWLYVVIAAVGLAFGFASSTVAYRYGWLRVPHQPFIERMQRELSLTPSQREQILQIIQDTRFKVESLRHEFQRQRRDQLTQARARVRALLTPEQQEKFDREFTPPIEREHEDEMRGGPHGP